MTDLEVFLAAVRILSPSSYELEDRRREVVAAAAGHDAPPPLAEALADDLYRRIYVRPRPAGRRPDDLARQRHLARLSEANGGRGSWEPGWRIREVGSAGLAAEKNGLVYRVAVADLRPTEGRIEAGGRCRVRIPKEMRRLRPGFYCAVGDAESGEERPAFKVRLYWHLRREGAAAWVRILTGGLNRDGVPFRLKVLASPDAYCRADAAVLYLDPAYWGAARGAIRHTHREVGAALRSEVPRLTLPLAPGLGVAEGPDGESFGEHRCRLIAGALVRAFEQGRETGRQRAEAVAAAFAAAGLDPEKPHLAAGSRTAYRPLAAGTAGATGSGTSGGPSFLDAARRIGETLCRSALWCGDRCNWLGHVSPQAEPAPGTYAVVAALGPDLYGGAAGVGLFLAELAATTGEDSCRRTAAGAVRCALSNLRDSSCAGRPLAFFTGQLGVAWAARRVAEATGAPDLAEAADVLLAGLLADLGGEHRLDLLSGSAGAVLALLDLHRRTGEPRCLAAATALGDEIVVAAAAEGDRWTWPNDRTGDFDPERAPLTGLSHGASGLGLALCELSAATGGRSYLEGARGAFAYEEAVFDPGRGNWPDFRRTGAGGGARFAAHWCHGAPGIALARLRARAIDPERSPALEAAARAGLATTLGSIDRRLDRPRADVSLCHGLCGLIEVAATAGRRLDEGRLRTAAERAMRVLLARHGESGRWPSGVRGRGPNPSLMLGDAGVGYTLLRLHAGERVPSVLAPGEPPRDQG